MLRDVVAGADFSTNAVIALLVFFLVFVGLTVWVLSRRQRTVDRWAGLPLDDDEAAPREPRTEPHLRDDRNRS
ncbi:Cbb3-type cytochrome oxidase component FixQ [Planctomycetes bacterium Pla163]|uniref:Cbb3-type cytochrome oxidase component FixQ n=1 Tax=Rohdeia mirabilis TaxID=2528008 RepID=A0A518CY03_9BACT|nr:Cbb3-type cytochrome oxidase component FixQ [Planctomycetes bacterium Pla163]